MGDGGKGPCPHPKAQSQRTKLERKQGSSLNANRVLYLTGGPPRGKNGGYAEIYSYDRDFDQMAEVERVEP